MSRGIQWYPQLTLAFGGISASYALIGSLAQLGRYVAIDNLTNGDLQLSLDGVTDHLPIAARSGKVIDVMANSKPGGCGDDGAVQGNGTSFYVKSITAPSSGSIYISYWNEYGEQLPPNIVPIKI